METAKVFQNGRSQAVRLPKEFRFDCDEVVVKKLGDMVLLYPEDKALDIFKESIGGFTDDFVSAVEEARSNDVQPKRESL
ncbi:MAG: type II toxin-antitoxin system VapB family antitoxin [Lachnospiraceae bacterium]|nr:type II toxin-antitoxin system VapB family antitoxin [Ruminococcus sp.]MCM1277180.1 type II toxin-antitoxin system VapB family antitoxin [Lachnospiraceae bacterium]